MSPSTSKAEFASSGEKHEDGEDGPVCWDDAVELLSDVPAPLPELPDKKGKSLAAKRYALNLNPT